MKVSFQILWIIDLYHKFRFMWQIINLSCLIFSLLYTNILFIQSVCLTQNQMSGSCFSFKAALALLLPLHNNETFIELCLPVVKNIVINIYFIFNFHFSLIESDWMNHKFFIHSAYNQISKIFHFSIKIKTKMVIICLKILVKMNFSRLVIWLVDVQTSYCLHSWDLIQLTYLRMVIM